MERHRLSWALSASWSSASSSTWASSASSVPHFCGSPGTAPPSNTRQLLQQHQQQHVSSRSSEELFFPTETKIVSIRKVWKVCVCVCQQWLLEINIDSWSVGDWFTHNNDWVEWEAEDPQVFTEAFSILLRWHWSESSPCCGGYSETLVLVVCGITAVCYMEVVHSAFWDCLSWN